MSSTLVRFNQGQLFREFVGAFITHPKPLIALVQGPAVGIAVTTLQLCDCIYASDNVRLTMMYRLMSS